MQCLQKDWGGWVCRMNHPGLLNWIDSTTLPHDGQQIWPASATSIGAALASWTVDSISWCFNMLSCASAAFLDNALASCIIIRSSRCLTVPCMVAVLCHVLTALSCHQQCLMLRGIAITSQIVDDTLLEHFVVSWVLHEDETFLEQARGGSLRYLGDLYTRTGRRRLH